MKRALIGGFLSLVGSIWTLAVVFIAGNHLVSAWHTPPGRLLTTVSELNLTALLVISVALTVAGIGILLVELFRKEA